MGVCGKNGEQDVSSEKKIVLFFSKITTDKTYYAPYTVRYIVVSIKSFRNNTKS